MKTKIFIGVLLAAALVVLLFRWNAQPTAYYPPIHSAQTDTSAIPEP